MIGDILMYTTKKNTFCMVEQFACERWKPSFVYYVAHAHVQALWARVKSFHDGTYKLF